ncbi:unnamed protein product [Rotaria magnacalcarata]|uniref:T-complex-associated testis-expressed protein 1 n=2 Tax=Rotaria magnacalcarata TaxID=392030 RepID=A0A815C492_9BILA|nr:unnamed protein product [Rotaria magnacalcarata]CAF1584207.1 unnamed protein product [Rotaria magnacalcarata]CAF1909306.1 unnamed protein product [Rotaria magnacalcarata]CAF4153436.1 unnamed protein product [Rotaria magnacalcarata]CAF4233721.1 unnamed protein product [Rotaria magnacalcarata]
MTDEASKPAPPATTADNTVVPPTIETQPSAEENVRSLTDDAIQAEVKYSMLNPELKPVRRIIADDLEWSLRIVPPLTDLALNSLVKSFDTNPKYDQLLDKHRNQLLKSLPTTVPLKVTAPLIEDETYWQKCCKEKWPICDIKLYGNSWKRFYFEKHIEEIIENFIPAQTDVKQLFDYVNLGAQYVKRLDIKQLLPPVEMQDKILQNEDEFFDDDDENELNDGRDAEVKKPLCDHFDFTELIKFLPNLEEFHLVYGVKGCGMNFDWNMFEFTKKDCQILAKCVQQCKTLRYLHLHRSKVDDMRIRMLIRDGLLDHPTLVELNFEHNQISDRGCRAIAKLLNGHSTLRRLNLCNNLIGPQGAQAIAYGITKSTSIEYLNLRLNRIGDEGGQAICLALLMNQTLRELNLSSNNLSEPTGNKLAEILNRNKTLTKIDMSANRLGGDIGKSLQEGLQDNSTLLYFDLRMTECGQESEYIINQKLKNNREQDRLRRIQDKNSHDAKTRTYSHLF